VPPRTAFVTGATGFLGLNLVDALLASSWHVVALHRKTSNVTRLRARGVALAEGTLDDGGALERAIPEGVDAVFHVAGNISLWSKNDAQQTKDNVDGTRNVANAALARKAKRFVHTSTVAVWGVQHELPYDETAPQHGGDSHINYQRSKHLGELEVRKAIERGLDAVIMNPAHIVGRYDTEGWSKSIRLVAEGKLPGIPPGKGSFCDAGAVARAHVAAVDRGRTGENYIFGGADATYVELVTTIGELLGKKVSKSAVPLWAISLASAATRFGSLFTGRQPAVTREMVAGLTHHEIVRCEKAVVELGYEKVPLRKMLETALAWQVEEGIVKAPPPS
jgi:nucleoside-diphosphate-sugar epimerase